MSEYESFISDLLVQNIKHTNNTTSMAIDTSGQVTIRGESSATTTSLQQGLAKVWSFCTQHTITDSLNTSSSSDDDIGKYTVNFTNNTATSNIAVSVTCNQNTNLNGHASNQSTSSFQIRLKDTSGNGTDANSGSAVHGDLA
tara:strand:+ start:218 stop:643 length:426 start_codon:yes stop_codon:yes gene_type:complete